MLEARSLRKAVVPTSLIEYPTPANLQSNHLSLHLHPDSSSCSAYVASASSIYRLQISMDDSLVGQGKESLLIPEQTQVVDSSLLNRCPHRSEIQSLVLTETESNNYLMLGTVDSYGHLIVSKLDSSGKDVDRIRFSVSPEDFGVGEDSWAGLCFSPSQWSMAAVTHSFGKCIDVYDQDIHLRTFRTNYQFPAKVCCLRLAAENQPRGLGIWDLRLKENGGCVQRVTSSVGEILFAVCNSSNGNIAVGGAERTVTIYDPRRWSALSRWINCTKYEITGLTFSSVDPNYIYVHGVDYECSNEDVLGGWCDSGSIFVADVVKGEVSLIHSLSSLLKFDVFWRGVTLKNSAKPREEVRAAAHTPIRRKVKCTALHWSA